MLNWIDWNSTVYMFKNWFRIEYSIKVTMPWSHTNQTKPNQEKKKEEDSSQRFSSKNSFGM